MDSKIFIEKIGADISKVTIGYFDIYNNNDDRIVLKTILSKLFSNGDSIYFQFRREENLTSDSETEMLRYTILSKFKAEGHLIYLRKLDEKRFDSIAMIQWNMHIPNFIIQVWKYFYACSFFKPENDLTFEEYGDYLKINGFNDIDGLKKIKDSLCNFICIKGLGADYLVITGKSELLDPLYNNIKQMGIIGG